MTHVADLRKVTGEDKRLTLIVSLLHTVRTGVRDDVVTMFCKRIGAIQKKGRDQLEVLREAHRAESERLRVFGEVLSVVREAVTLAGTENEDPQPGGGTAETSAPDGTAAAQQAGRLVSRPWTRREGLRR